MFHPQQQIGPYLLIRLLGQSGFGQVWLAEKPGKLMTTQVAVKLPLDPTPDLDAIRHEAQTWLRASGHPNVLPVIDADIYSGQVIIVSEYAAGGSLASWLTQDGGKAPSVKAAVAMTDGILAGLEYLHTLTPEPIIHRDLKPDNILLQGGLPRLTDFGISRVLKTTDQTKSASGTPHYMPPEAFAGKYSPRSDVWAAGVMLYQMLSGQLPFPQADLPSLYGAILTATPAPLPSDIPATLRNAVMSALQKDPARRPQSAAAMRILLNSNRTEPDHVSNPITGPVPSSRRAFLWGLGVVGAGAFLGYWRYGHSPDHPPRVIIHDDVRVPRKDNIPSVPGETKVNPGSLFEMPPIRNNAVDGSEMTWIPAGFFYMGSTDGENDEKPAHLVYMSGFRMYTKSVTVVQFRKYDALNGRVYDWTKHKPDWGWIDTYPMVNVTWAEASAYAKWAEAALPTEAQWEFAARGGKGNRYPWGDIFDSSKLRCSEKKRGDANNPVPVGMYPANKFGLYDMAGNVWQWCADWYDKDYYAAKAASEANPTGPSDGTARVVRGGSWFGDAITDFRCANRNSVAPHDRGIILGFRCCSPGYSK